MGSGRFSMPGSSSSGENTSGSRVFVSLMAIRPSFHASAGSTRGGVAALLAPQRCESRPATGLVVVGDLLGEGEAQERGVVGETPNLAARLQAMAAPNMLIIAAATRWQVGGLFDLADLGPRSLAGFAELQPAWQVLGES